MALGAIGGIFGAAAGGEVGRAIVEVVGDSSKLQADLAKAKAQTATATTQMGAQTKKFSSLSTGAFVAIGTAAVAGVGFAIKAASDLGEQMSRARVVFEDSTDSVVKFSETSADKLGIAQSAALEAASSFGAMAQGAGLSEEASAKMSIKLVTLAADMASFNNQDPSEMLIRLRAGLAGEAEPLRRFSVFIDEARVKAEAYRSGIAEVGEELTTGQKIQARFNVIMQDTAKQQGDFARTVGESLPNQLRRLKASLTDTAAGLGQVLLPVLTTFTKTMVDLLPLIKPVTAALLALAGAFVAVKVAAVVGTALVSLGAALESFAIVRTLGTAVGLFGIQLASLGPHIALIAGAIVSLTLIIQNWQAAFEGVGKSVASALPEEFYSALGKAAAGTDGLTGKMGTLRGALDETTAASEDLLTAQLALSGGVVGIAAAVDSASDAEKDLAVARAEVARLTKEGKEGSQEYKEAVEAVGDAARGSLQSQLNLAGAVQSFAEEASKTGDIQGAIDRVRDFGQKAGLTKTEINKLVGQVKDAIREIGNLPGAKRIDFSTPGLPDALNRIQGLKNKLDLIPKTVTTRFVILGDEINPRPTAAGGIIAGQAGFITRGPTMLVGESRKMTFAGRGAEAVIPFDNKGIGILAKALQMAVGSASPGGGGRVVHQHVNFDGAQFFGERDIRQMIRNALGELRQRGMTI